MTRCNLLLMTLLEGAAPKAGPAVFAAGAAAALGAHLHVLAPRLDILAADKWDSRNTRQLEHDDEERHARLEERVKAIVARASALGVSARGQTEWAHPFGPIPFAGDLAKLHDIIVMGTDRSTFLSERKFAEHVLFEAGRPVVVVPPDHVGPFSCARVMIAWDHTRAAARALHDALPLLRLADELVMLSIGGEKRFQTELDSTAIVEALARKGLKARFAKVDMDSRTIGRALQDHALADGSDLLVMGAFGHSRLREFILGGATREVLDELRLPVLMSH